MLPLFQNCGMEASTNKALFVGEGSPDCLSSVVDCGPQQEFLEITMDLANPTTFAATETELYAYGRCNTGNYPKHSVRVTSLCSGDGSPRVDVDEFGACVRGRYMIPISIAGYPTSRSCSVSVQIIGYEQGEDGSDIPAQNIQANGSATVDFSIQ